MLRNQITYTLLALLLAPMSLAQEHSDADVANERIPVDKMEMEAQWRVNCAEVWSRVQDAARLAVSGEDCGYTAPLRREVQLCAFIHQPPGGDFRHRCPDYDTAFDLLQPVGTAADCSDRHKMIRQQASCEAQLPTSQ